MEPFCVLCFVLLSPYICNFCSPVLKCEPTSHLQCPLFHQKFDVLREGPLLLEGDNQKDSMSSASAAPADSSFDFKHRRSSSKWSEELSTSGSAITESTQAGELISGSKLVTVCSIMLCLYIIFVIYLQHIA